MTESEQIGRDITGDIESVKHSKVVTKLLETASKIKGMRFSAVAMFTDKHWIAFEVNDEINFGSLLMRRPARLALGTIIAL